VKNVEQIEFSGYSQSGAILGWGLPVAGHQNLQIKKKKKEGNHQHERRRPTNRRRGIVRLDREKEN
jgi:hypothetical protein